MQGCDCKQKEKDRQACQCYQHKPQRNMHCHTSRRGWGLWSPLQHWPCLIEYAGDRQSTYCAREPHPSIQHRPKWGKKYRMIGRPSSIQTLNFRYSLPQNHFNVCHFWVYLLISPQPVNQILPNLEGVCPHILSKCVPNILSKCVPNISWIHSHLIKI